ncbi:MAG TPA: hypothetical protein VF064_04340 [Pyrinomonadaceae bacterium]
MKRLVLLTLFLAPFAHVSFAQGEEFRIERASKKYDLAVRVEECGGPEQRDDPDTCGGPARVSFYRKGAKTPFQTLRLPNVEIYRETLAHNPQTSAKPRRLYAEEYGFVFDDFDFDGAEDLAICNGRNSGYGGPSYSVFLFDAKTRKFVENRRLSALAEGAYLGLFFPDKKKKQLVAHSKSGCCYHETEKYKVVNNRPVLVEKITEQATGRDDGAFDVVTTTSRRVGHRWITRVKREVSKGY